MPRFVILTHDFPFMHWDLLLEEAESLRSWRLLCEPDVDVRVQADGLPPHRKRYLDYEGPVSGDRGSVHRWDAGTFRWGDTARADRVVIALAGSRISGEVTLTRIDGDRWEFYCRSSGS